MANNVSKPEKKRYPCTLCGNDEFITSATLGRNIRRNAWLIGWVVVSRKQQILGFICRRCRLGGKTKEDVLTWGGKGG